jgi:3-methylcrotonyl-CoA carboxylase alpha subunit
MRTVLVANRGEIACRVIRSCRSLGLRSVAVYSEADANAMHVQTADMAVAIGPSPARESYLRVDRILEAARHAGADAIHPGYGFLSENAAFASAVAAAGMVWIGPAPASIVDMGDKQRARELAAASGVPVLAGSRRFPEGQLDGLEDAAVVVGYPLLVKAAAGGGGIGMRKVESRDQLRAIAEATQSMAAKSFGDGSIYLERFVARARHVEIQVFGFGGGEAVHLFERDCSLQRRFQKVVEESPAPGLPLEVRERMAACAKQLCAEISYEGAGTIEFVVDADSFEFFFLEMNTRIQVEHPVTEMVTGRDLVAMQIEQARGTLRPLAQSEITPQGHAIECRIYAENPTKNFMPSPGQLKTLEFPAPQAWLRIDTGFRSGDEITFFYDPMIAKLICHGATRGEAIERALAALAATRVDGPATNITYLQAVLGHAAFRQGEVFTGFLEHHRIALLA